MHNVFLDTNNKENVKLIEKCLTVVCLDDPHPHLEQVDFFTDAQSTIACNNCLHGNGSHFNTCNRWFDSAGQVYYNKYIFTSRTAHLFFVASCG